MRGYSNLVGILEMRESEILRLKKVENGGNASASWYRLPALKTHFHPARLFEIGSNEFILFFSVLEISKKKKVIIIECWNLNYVYINSHCISHRVLHANYESAPNRDESHSASLRFLLIFAHLFSSGI